MAFVSRSVALAILFLSSESHASEIAVIIDGNFTTYEQRFITGAKQAGENLGVGIKLYSPSFYHDNGSLLSLMRNVLDSKPLGVVVESRWNTEIATMLATEHIQGNIVWTNPQTGFFSDATNFVAWDNAHAGAVAADALAEAVRSHKGKSTGDIVLIAPSSASTTENSVTAGFKHQVTEKYPDLKIVDSAFLGSDSSFPEDITSYISAHPNIVGVYASNFGLGSAAARAVAQQDKAGKINIVATSGLQTGDGFFNNIITENALANINPYIVSTGAQFIVQDPFELAYQSTKTVFESSKGDLTYQAQYIKTAMTISGNELPTAFRYWSQGPGPGSVADPRVVPILYATDRKVENDDRQDFSGERDSELHYGIAFVRVPDHHGFGRVERPNWLVNWIREVLFGGGNIPVDEFLIDRKQGVTEQRFNSIVTSSQAKTAIVFVHGFRNSFDDSLFRLAQVIFDGQLGDMIPIMFSWPSRGDIKDYEYDADSANASIQNFETLLKALQKNDHVSNISIIAHSMGNRVLLDAISDVFKSREIDPLSELILAAPDVDLTHFLQTAPSVQKAARGVTLYASSADVPLGLSGEIAQMRRAGIVGPDGPVVVQGIDSIDVTTMGNDLFALNHDTYANSDVIDDIARIIRSETRPPNFRTARIVGVPEGAEHPRYWKYAQ
jgi:esterase/lipase superfamily enzyme/ABC-type sugar transport system substrate-binding protein